MYLLHTRKHVKLINNRIIIGLPYTTHTQIHTTTEGYTTTVVIVLYTGVGTSFALSPTLATVGQYFEKRRALANSIGGAGVGVGGLILPPLFALILDEYSVFGTLLILAGLMLNVAVTGALLRPLEFYTTSRLSKGKPQGYTTTEPGPQYTNTNPGPSTHDTYKGTQLQSSIQHQDNCGYPQEDRAPAGNSTKVAAVVQELSPSDLSVVQKPTSSVETERKHSIPTIQEGVTKNKFQFSVIKIPTVYIYGVSIFFLFSGLPVVLMFLPAFGISVGLSDQDALSTPILTGSWGPHW